MWSRLGALSKSLLAKAWFSCSILSVSLLRTARFNERTIPMVPPWMKVDDEVDLFLVSDIWLGCKILPCWLIVYEFPVWPILGTDDHFPFDISTSLLSRIWLSLLIAMLRSEVTNVWAFFLSSFDFFSCFNYSFTTSTVGTYYLTLAAC